MILRVSRRGLLNGSDIQLRISIILLRKQYENKIVSGNMKYRIKIMESDEGFAVWCEDLPGCFSQGETENEAIQNIKIAIEEYLEAKEAIKSKEKSIFLEV